MNMLYKFSQEQLKVLLKGSGYSRVAGLDLGSEPLNDITVLNTLNELVNLKLISSDGKTFSMSDDAEKITALLGNADRCAAVRTSRYNLPDLCCYSGREILVCFRHGNNPNFISVYLTDFEDLFTDLDEQGYFFGSKGTVMPKNADLAGYEQEIFADCNPNAPIPDNSPIMLDVSVLSAGGAVRKYLRAVEYYALNYIVYYDGKETQRTCYDYGEIKKYLRMILEK